MSLYADFSLEASTFSAVIFFDPSSLLRRAATSLARLWSESAMVTDFTSGLRAMSYAAAEPIMPEPITSSFIAYSLT